MSISCRVFDALSRAPRPHEEALDTYTDEMHSKYGGAAGDAMTDDTWAAMTPDEAARYRQLERAANGEHEEAKVSAWASA